MTKRVSAIIEMRISQIKGEGWLFPAETASGHIEPSSLKKQHMKALKASGVSPFELYVLRHTCLTRWAKWMNPFTFHRVAGHADMKTTMRTFTRATQTWTKPSRRPAKRLMGIL